jgi:hypothetical protein
MQYTVTPRTGDHPIQSYSTQRGRNLKVFFSHIAKISEILPEITTGEPKMSKYSVKCKM